MNALCRLAEHFIIIRDIAGKTQRMTVWENKAIIINAAKAEKDGRRIVTLGWRR